MENQQYINEQCWYKGLNSCNHECKNCIRYKIIKIAMNDSGVPEELHHPIPLKPSACDVEKFDRLAEIKKNIDDFVYSGGSLYICSSKTGNGKTSWAIKLMYKYFSLTWEDGIGVRALFINVVELLLKLKDFNHPISKEYRDLIISVPLVIWDDIAITGISSWDYMQLYVLLNERSMRGLANIYTSNCTTIEQLANFVGNKIASRIWTKSTEVIELKGEDRR